MLIPFGFSRANAPTSPSKLGQETCLVLTRACKALNLITPTKLDLSTASFDIPGCFYPGADRLKNAKALFVLMECLIACDQLYLRDHVVPALYQSDVVYDRTLEWDTTPVLYKKGFGDCKSLAAQKVAEYRKVGRPARFAQRWATRDGAAYDQGNLLFHILVQTSDGYEDPSKNRGMGGNENLYF